jgi:hypothetical protein
LDGEGWSIAPGTLLSGPALRFGVGLRLVVHAAEQHHRGDGVKRRLADGDADHRFTDGYQLASSRASKSG